MKYWLILLALTVSITYPSYGQENAELPELPSVNENPANPETVAPERTSRNLPAVNLPTHRMPKMSQQQMEKMQHDKNWLTEGLKAKELEAEALRKAESQKQKTVIDEILERNQQQMSSLSNTGSTQPHTQSNAGGMKAAITTTAWEPLPEMGTSPFVSSSQANSQLESNTESFKQFDEKTGVANVFYNPLTGTFDSRPVSPGNQVANQPEMVKPWMQQTEIPTADEAEVTAFEARLVEQARLQNKLPANFENPNLGIDSGTSPLLANSSTNAAGATPNQINNPFLNPQQNNTTGYAASAAKLRMMEKERQRQQKQNNRPDPIDIHSPFKGKGVDINPRF